METVGGFCKGKLGKLSDVDLQQISGKREQLAARIQEVYGITKHRPA